MIDWARSESAGGFMLPIQLFTVACSKVASDMYEGHTCAMFTPQLVKLYQGTCFGIVCPGAENKKDWLQLAQILGWASLLTRVGLYKDLLT